jgi:hypothetical protein
MPEDGDESLHLAVEERDVLLPGAGAPLVEECP